MTIRQQIEEREEEILSPFACLSINSKGRDKDEPQCDIRPVFQRDRDRILHSKSFRRLKNKTQVFLTPKGDHYRTRMSHTLEVSQNARTIAKALRLNEDLVEAIALGHDLGHTPFGHAGENILNEIYEGGFKHNEQSVRIVEKLEKDGAGLNLTWEVRDGILNHQTSLMPHTLEGKIVRLSDKIAYINSDFDDAIRAQLLCEDDIPLEIRKTLGFNKSERINTLVTSCIKNSGSEILLDGEIQQAFDEIHKFMFRNVYTNPICKSEESKAIDMICWLYRHFSENPLELPSEYTLICLKEGPQRAACDYIAGMTDRYAVHTFNRLLVPGSWMI